MNLLFNYKGILKGTVSISDEKKYGALAIAVAAVHLVLIFIFLYAGSIPMVIYNIASVAGYLACLRPIKKKSLLMVYFYICTEVIIHSMLATYTVGWDCGFALYLIAIIPVGFDMAFALKDTIRGISAAMAFGVISFAILMGCKLYSAYFEPTHEITNERFILFMYIFNILCTCILLIVYSYIFTAEIFVTRLNLEENNKKLDSLASVDTLTGLYTRRKMSEILNKAVESGDNFSIIMSDIDDFKHVNDTYGHDCGDRVLEMVSGIVADCMPDGDNVCRWGGEEFLIITHRPLNEAADIAEKIRAAVESRCLDFGGKTIRITLTLGVSEFNPNSNIDSIITAADKNLYIGKNSGKNCVISADGVSHL